MIGMEIEHQKRAGRCKKFKVVEYHKRIMQFPEYESEISPTRLDSSCQSAVLQI
jgi:hypothetical protein